MTWLANIYADEAEEFRRACRWKTKIGPPQATAAYSVKKLQAMGYVGIYKVETGE